MSRIQRIARAIQAAGDLGQELESLKGKMAQAAQEVYDNRESDDEGLCDTIACALGNVIAENLGDVDTGEGGQPGDDHAYIMAHRDGQVYEIDIPYSLYEQGGGYNWTVHQDVVFSPEDVHIELLEGVPWEDDYYG